jgi:hypothetical protein
MDSSTQKGTASSGKPLNLCPLPKTRTIGWIGNKGTGHGEEVNADPGIASSCRAGQSVPLSTLHFLLIPPLFFSPLEAALT